MATFEQKVEIQFKIVKQKKKGDKKCNPNLSS